MNLSNYKRNKERAVYRNSAPTLTDQSQGHETDINVIVKRYGIGGSAPGSDKQPLYGDFTEVPDNLRDMIDLSRQMTVLRGKLPPQLAEMPDEQLLALLPAEVHAILHPPADPPAKTEGDPK